jgi:hypothetical protein
MCHCMGVGSVQFLLVTFTCRCAAHKAEACGGQLRDALVQRIAVAEYFNSPLSPM